ncbi:MAG TPA: aspartate aminotransferase family protein [Chitinophagales bacterium]|nr:aspartate aminotransferase family protein [Chitinophagales bacterium]HMU99239.1 aspartate aminotransferase family protein [Chitinophagales bacterium]HMV03746.1 aspartate aminotransferase family protein [Chitinophagales bacterium]HMW95466.1 aspartate aminotransferase family protein [Chitinophagales bacterium]HMZ69727.1 aspartate aminotransferase family protein [Chitinophagales bacterium]
MLSQRQLFLQHVAQTSPEPLALEIEKAEGIYLYDISGKKYIDLIAGISVSNIGHCHPNVVNAIQQQAQTYMHTLVYGEFIQSPQVQLAKYLSDLLPENLNSIYFTNSGAEATEGAMKLAKRFTGKPEIISCVNAYHGSTQGALSLLGDEFFKSAFRPLLPDTRQIRYNNLEDIELITERTAAIFLESVQAEAGVIAPTKEFLIAVRQKCNETGTLLVLDEIQTGCGRTGKLFAFEHFGILPDIILLAKGLGGGMPIGCFISDKKILQSLTHNPVLGHITTFGGNAVCCAAALANIQTIHQQELYIDVPKKAALFLQLLKHPKIKKINNFGLLMAVYLDSFEQIHQVIQYCLKNGLITDWFLFANNCLRIAPPLIITEDEIQASCSILLAALDTL